MSSVTYACCCLNVVYQQKAQAIIMKIFEMFSNHVFIKKPTYLKGRIRISFLTGLLTGWQVNATGLTSEELDSFILLGKGWEQIEQTNLNCFFPDNYTFPRMILLTFRLLGLPTLNAPLQRHLLWGVVCRSSCYPPVSMRLPCSCSYIKWNNRINPQLCKISPGYFKSTTWSIVPN